MFQQKAVQDCSFTVDRMEQFRTEFRASLLWLDNISRELNPEDREQLEKFRKVRVFEWSLNPNYLRALQKVRFEF